MKRIQFLLWVLVLVGATEACGQSGLYGAPEVIPFPPTNAVPLPARMPVAAQPPDQPTSPPNTWEGRSPSWEADQSRFSDSAPGSPGMVNPSFGYSGSSVPRGDVPYGMPVARGSAPGQPVGGAYRYAQAPNLDGPPGPAALPEPESPPIEAPATGFGYPEQATETSLPYVGPPGPEPLRSRPTLPLPEARWGQPSVIPPGGESSFRGSSEGASRPNPSGEPASPNLVDQMLRESEGGNPVYTGFGTEESPLAKALDVGGCSEPCGCWGFLVADCPWYVTVLGFMIGRDEPNRFWTSYETDNNPNQLMHTNDIGLEWRAGGEVRFGRRFGCCGNWAIEAAYWTMDPFEGETAISHPNGVSTPIDLEYVWFYRNADDCPMAADLFDNAIEHRLKRRNEFHNVEINFLRLQRLADPHFPLDLHWGLGARWLRFEEDLLFGTLRSGSWGAAGGVQEAYIDQEVKNDLIGAQLSLDITYFIHRNWRIFVTPRIGLYNNHIQMDFQVYRGDGTVASPQPASRVAGTYPVRATTDTLSFLTQVDIGAEWRFAKNWSAAIGYRVIVATGIGLADNQFPAYLVDLPEVEHIDHNGHLILHGGFASLTFNF